MRFLPSEQCGRTFETRWTRWTRWMLTAGIMAMGLSEDHRNGEKDQSLERNIVLVVRECIAYYRTSRIIS